MVHLDTPLAEKFLKVAVDRRKRRYQRTASTSTSDGKQKPTKAERGGIDRRKR
jgi:hypothetical protein